jgi:4-amino-4-deoxy-L-arabinose transferase-like glycosyltransferase
MSIETHDDRPLCLLAAALALLMFVLPLAVNFPLLDPDEGLHASIAQEMVERGDWVVPHFLGKPFLDKPILYFWCQALSLECFGMNEFAVRLPGLLLGLLGCITTGAVGGKMFGRTAGLISGIFYGTMILPVALAQAAAHDVALVPCVNLAILLFFLSDRARSWKTSAGYALAIGIILGLAILAKGLVGVAMIGITYGSYLLITRQFTFAACYRGLVSLVIAAAIASLWYLAVEHREPGYLRYYFLERHLLGFATATQSHGDAPWWLYLPVLLGGGLPWIGYLPITIRELFATRSSKNHAAYLLWCWLIGCTLLLSLAQSKLVTYLWPVFPAVAILAAIGWSKLIEGTISPTAKKSLRKNFVMSSFVGPFVLPVAVLVLQKAFGVHFGPQIWAAVVIVGLGTLAPLWFVFREKWQAMLIASALTVTAQFLLVMFLVVPIVADTYSEKQLAAYFSCRRTDFQSVQSDAGDTRQVGILSYDSTALPIRLYFVEQRIGSFVFYLNPAVRASIADGQLQEIPRPKNAKEKKTTFQPGDVVVVPEKRVDRAREYVDLDGLSSRKVGQFSVLQK